MNPKIIKKSVCPICNKSWESTNCQNPASALNKHLGYCQTKNNFLKQFSFTKETLEAALRQEGSVLGFSKKYIPLFDGKISDCTIRRIFSDFQIDTSIRAATNEKTKSRRIMTNLERYGAPCNLCKGTESRKKWETRLLREEGITNVFQREEVKHKILETSLKKYGKLGMYYNRIKGSTLEYWIDRLGGKLGTERYNQICYNKGKSNRLSYYIEKYGEEEGKYLYDTRLQKICSNYSSISSLSYRVSHILDRANISYEMEYCIKQDEVIRFFDFKINNILLELNEDYWHANPCLYKKDDIINYPNYVYLTAEAVWNRDDKKKCLAESFGYTVCYIWEKDMNQMTDTELLDKIKNICNI